MAATHSMRKIVYSPDYKTYDLGSMHPFSPVRNLLLVDLLKEMGVFEQYEKPSAVSPEELMKIHSEEYIKITEAISEGKNSEEAEAFGFGTQDNPVVKGMAEAARLQAGGTKLGAELILQNKAQKVLQLGGGFHHAHSKLAAGFCIYNDLALAIKTFAEAGWHVAYIDIDVHHGDGVQEIFYSDGKVMTISFHESGEYLFPGSGWIYETGSGMGRSLKLNVPFEPFTEGDSYIEVFDAVTSRALGWYRPDVIVVQAGSDAHYSDPLADLLLTTRDYEKIFKKLLELSEKFSKGNILFTLGGGYSLFSTIRVWSILYFIFFGKEIPEKIPQGWVTKWEEKFNSNFPHYFHDKPAPYESIPRKEEIVRHNKDLVRRLFDAVSPDWL